MVPYISSTVIGDSFLNTLFYNKIIKLPAKSKGVRLVSAKQEINQTNEKGRERKINHK
jgi:hypothetical protein